MEILLPMPPSSDSEGNQNVILNEFHQKHGHDMHPLQLRRYSMATLGLLPSPVQEMIK
jgi:hypothetical protein